MIESLHSLLIALAQAGGGGSFGGGGGGGGGGFSGGGGGGFSGGGGGGGGDFGVGQIVVVLIFFAIFTLANRSKAAKGTRAARTIRKGVKVQEEALRQQALAAIAQRDPAFDLGVFLQRAAQGFVTTQAAWSEQDLRTCRAFISDGVHERFELYIAMQQAEDIRNRMRDVAVTGWEVVAVSTGSHFDTIHVRITARAISYNESLTTGRRVSGGSDSSPLTFTEIWSFSRRPGVQTRTDASLMQGTCPNCGSPIGIVDRAVCGTCDSVVNSGAYDWVLAEITQDEEWIVPTTRPIPGWAALAAKDEGLNQQHLEDRASVLYWRCMLAVYFGDIDYAAPVLPTGSVAVPPLWQKEGDAYWFTPAVGSVEVLAAQAGDDVDRVQVQVRWSAATAWGDRQSPQVADDQRIHTHVIVLQRRAGVVSDVTRSLTSFSCTNCGGPLDVGKMTACRFCGTPVNDGSTDWIVEDVVPFEAVQAWLQQAQRTAQPVDATAVGGAAAPGGGHRLVSDRLSNEPELLIALASMAAADGHLDAAEAEHLTQMATRRGVPIERVQRAVASGEASTTTITLPTDPHEARAFLVHLIHAALIDGRITRQERALLTTVAGRMGLGDADLDRMIAKEQTALAREAKQIIRDAPPTDPRFAPPPLPGA